MVSIQEYQLTRHDNQALISSTIERLEATIKQLREFARIRRSRCIGEFAGRIKCDASLSGVRDDKTNLRLFCQCHESLILAVWIKGTTDAVNASEGIHLFTIQSSLQIDVIEAILTIEPIHHTLLDRLHNHYRRVEVCLLIHVIDNPVHKTAKEVSLAKLDNSLRCMALRSRASVQCFECHIC